MGLSEDIRRQLIASFKTEQREYIQNINQGLLALEKKPNGENRQDLLNEIFRQAHSLKGAARAVGMTTIESISHNLEDLLLRAKGGQLAFSPELFDLLYQALDAIELLIKGIEEGDSSTPAKVLTLITQLENFSMTVKTNLKSEEEQTYNVVPEAESKLKNEAEAEASAGNMVDKSTSALGPSQHIPQDETIRVSVTKLDALMAQFSELLGAKIRAEQRLAEVRTLQTFAVDWQKEWRTIRGQYNRLVRKKQDQDSPNGLPKEVSALIEFNSRNQEQLRTFGSQSNTLYRQLSNDTMRLSLIIDELQEEIKRVRMLPLKTITASFGRMVRDLAREQEKQISLTITGDSTELDKRVLEQIKDPLIHLLRNAVDHGLETTTERHVAGKTLEANIVLAASQQGNNVVITVSDDGRGLDVEAIRLAAVRKGLLKQSEAAQLTEKEITALIFASGMSTSKIITDISGRGVGLDVVRQNVEELHGLLEVDFQPGQSTSFSMTLPLTLASSRGLLVTVGEQIFALPLTTIERMLQIEPAQIARIEGKEAITYQNKPIAVVWLADLLELPPPNQIPKQLKVVIITVAEKRLGLIVDDLAGEQEIVMKGLGKQLAKVGGIAGATVLGSGQVILVLHSADLIKLSARTQARVMADVDTNSKNDTAKRKTILVVDDSITTRTLEKNILEAAGYEVKLAIDGEEALAHLVSNGLPNLIVSDINMPRLDGFGLTKRVKLDERYAEIPVILVTSLDSPADKAHGIEVGADAYIVKSSFDQTSLLETIEQLV